jgi:hypothetical protein
MHKDIEFVEGKVVVAVPIHLGEQSYAEIGIAGEAKNEQQDEVEIAAAVMSCEGQEVEVQDIPAG